MTILRDPRPGYQTHGEQTIQRGDRGQTIIRTDRFDGSSDATVRVKALRLHITVDAPTRKQLVAAIGELEEATRELRLARASGHTEWVGYAKRRLAAANRRVQEVQ